MTSALRASAFWIFFLRFSTFHHADMVVGAFGGATGFACAAAATQAWADSKPSCLRNSTTAAYVSPVAPGDGPDPLALSLAWLAGGPCPLPPLWPQQAAGTMGS